MEKISVIIPVYKTPGMAFRKCMESITQQTYQNLEIIVVDDGNSDSYQYILREIEQSDARITVLHQQNQGVSSARNHGIEHATGDYIAFVDSDDFLDCSCYTKMLEAMADSDIVICGVADQYYPTIGQWYDRRQFFSYPSKFNGVQYLNFPVNKLFRAKIIKENNLQFPVDVKLGEDALFVASYLKYCKSVQVIPDLLYHYVYSPTSAVHSYKENYWKWEEEVILRQWEMFHEYALTENETQACLAWLFRKIRGAAYYYLANEKNPKKLHKYLQQIVQFKFFNELQFCDLSVKNAHLTKREKNAIRLWLRMKEKGIRTTFYLGRR